MHLALHLNEVRGATASLLRLLRQGAILQRAKALVAGLLGHTGREVRRAPGLRSGVQELSGITFPDFLALFVRSRNPEDLSFIQVGAHDGRSNDWLYDLALQHGLRGILVEPQSRVFRELKENYRDAEKLTFENVAISDHDGQQNLYVLRSDLDFLQYANQVASFSYDHIRSQLAKHLRRGAAKEVVDEMNRRGLTVEQCIEIEVVETCTFATLVEQHNVDRYDILQIDAEGFDFEIIKLANLDHLRPALINYESEHLSPADQARAWRYLADLGYRVFTHEGDTAAFLPAMPRAMPPRPRPASARPS